MRGQRSIFDQNGWLNWFWCIVKQKGFFIPLRKNTSHLWYEFSPPQVVQKNFFITTQRMKQQKKLLLFFALYDLISTQFSFVTGQVFWIIFACLLFMCNLCNKVRTKLAFLDEEGKVKKNKRLQLGHFNPNLEFLLFVYKY